MLSQHCSGVGSGVGNGVGLGVGEDVVGAGEIVGKLVGDTVGEVGDGVPTDSQLVQQVQKMSSQSASKMSSSNEHKSTGIAPFKSVSASFTSFNRFKRSKGGTVPVN